MTTVAQAESVAGLPDRSRKGASRDRPSICFVAPAGYPVLARDREIPFAGGAEVQQAFLATGLAARGYRVSMISMDYGQTEGATVRGVRLLKMHKPDGGMPVIRFVHPRLTSLWSAMSRADADVYYQRAAGALTGFVAAYARRRGRASIFASAHDGDFERDPPNITYARDRAIYRWGVSRTSAVVVQTEKQVALCRASFRREPVQINSAYLHDGRPAAFEGHVLWVATAKRHKRPHLLLEVARALPAYRFCLVGGPAGGADERAYYDALCEAARSLPNVDMVGFVPVADVERYFDGASVFVNTSVAEGFPNTFLQAWSRRIPTVSFFDPGIGVAGRPAGISVAGVEDMIRAVGELKSNRQSWQAAGDTAERAFAEHFTLERALDQYERVIENVTTPLGRRSSSAARS